MIYGIGVDSTGITRMDKSMQRTSFMQRVFGTQEQAFLQQKTENRKAESAAANFAAKEAFLKATGNGLGKFALSEIEVLRKPNGAPYFLLSGAAQNFVLDNHLKLHLSLTHDGGLATAFVLLECEEP